MPRITSMDVTIAGCTRSFSFGEGAEVQSDDEGEASLELLRDAETTEVVLVNRKTYEVSVVVTRTQRATTTLLVAAENEEDAQEWAERDYDAEYDTDWDDADSDDVELEVQEVNEYSDDEDDAAYSA